MNKDFAFRSCPNCESTRLVSRPVAVSHIPAESLSFSQVMEYFVGIRKEQVFFSYYRCATCQLVYCPVYFTSEQLRTLYSNMPDNLMGEDKNVISKTQSGYVKWLRRRVSDVSNYLEVGPDIGLVGDALSKSFEINKATMIEPNLRVHEDLKQSLKRVSKVEVLQYIEEVDSDSKFDMIVGVHVYDHLLNPRQDLENLVKVTTPNSKIFVVVHDENSLLRKAMGSKWPPFCLQHPQLYDPHTLSELLRNSGWVTQSWLKTVNWWNLEHIANLGLSVLGLNSKWTKVLPSLEIPLKLGNQAMLATRN